MKCYFLLIIAPSEWSILFVSREIRENNHVSLTAVEE